MKNKKGCRMNKFQIKADVIIDLQSLGFESDIVLIKDCVLYISDNNSSVHKNIIDDISKSRHLYQSLNANPLIFSFRLAKYDRSTGGAAQHNGTEIQPKEKQAFSFLRIRDTQRCKRKTSPILC